MHCLVDHYVRVMTFCGTKTPFEEVGLRQNYWKLINHIGKVIRKREIAHLALSKSQLQLLVQFGDEVDKYNLSSYNEEKNSFWIPYQDLELVRAKESA
ncbi:MAG TPA: hypothetical protein CFH79_08705 [Sulfurospirillum sp. UBA11407]|nr:MAG TPA: hypothetical protein CFH79_08705 [Sulfurospirillum sp. UBA11407]